MFGSTYLHIHRRSKTGKLFYESSEIVELFRNLEEFNWVLATRNLHDQTFRLYVDWQLSRKQGIIHIIAWLKSRTLEMLPTTPRNS